VLDDLLKSASDVCGVKLVAAQVNVQNQEDLKVMGDQLRDKIGSGIAVLVSALEDKVALITLVSKDLTGKFHAGKIVGELAPIVGGKGGGRPDMAMAGGKQIENIAQLLKTVPEIIGKF
jgi:alanyl-tRNA synthetase